MHSYRQDMITPRLQGLSIKINPLQRVLRRILFKLLENVVYFTFAFIATVTTSDTARENAAIVIAIKPISNDTIINSFL